MTILSVSGRRNPSLWVIPATRARSDRFGGRQCFLPDSWQQTFGKQSSVLLQGFGWLSKTGGGGGVHCRYPDTASNADKQKRINMTSNVLLIILTEYIRLLYSRYDNWRAAGNGRASNSGRAVLQYLVWPSGQHTLGQQSWSVIHVWTCHHNSARGSDGHLRGRTPRIAGIDE